MKVLVTGASSLLGRHCVDTLVRGGHRVRTFQRQPSESGHEEVLGDIVNKSDLERAVEGTDAVIHLAAKVEPSGRWSDFEAVNLTGTINLVDASREAGVSRFIYVSSPSVANTGIPLMGAGAADADPDTTRDHYSTSKAMAEVAALAASDSSFAVVAVRPHLVWGPGDTQLVGRIVDRARSGRLAQIGSGLALVDSTYVTNAADALVAALERADQLAGRKFVVSNGEPRPVSELLGRILVAAGLTPPARRVPGGVARTLGLLFDRAWQTERLKGEPPITRFGAEQLSSAHWFDQRDTREALDWQPRVSLDEGFALLGRWFES